MIVKINKFSEVEEIAICLECGLSDCRTVEHSSCPLRIARDAMAPKTKPVQSDRDKKKAALREKAAEMYRAGVPAHEIKDYFGIEKGALRKWLNRCGETGVLVWDNSKIKEKKQAEMRGEALKMFRQGVHPHKIKDKFGIEKGTLRRWLNQCGETGKLLWGRVKT